ncbi:hypothetical protein [Moraxella pluranimalium]|uniref:Uncharacterized protein n=1 Tax=Moraxella pluranimalium TaxID=470453 RepID=A0A1T0CM14_9GAMM|nr:hypothetical protein [Moraxella pluranimalium]OOS23343.1 hypothetical protein B0680_07135 [Moraxella pluranimalium]
MTILMWLFVIIWAIFFVLYLVGMILAGVKHGLGGVIHTLLGLMAFAICSLIYWGILIFLDIQFNFLHWF